MAASSAFLSTFISPQTVSFSPKSSSSLRLLSPTSVRMDPENKKIINCDEKLKKIFGGKDRIGFLEIAGLISPHFL
ncbi:hypothetical protein Goarm_005986 [Gossypium armourianum]|uniref:SWIB domain-containing protein n=1 Tax=Gossypium armourianum TaxID=34283 RepID=A0A7J9JGM2_9ROSI|nr:hypothetical protein [Gossypium armourianum]